MVATSSDKKMNRILAQFQKQGRPKSASARPMTDYEHKTFFHKHQDQRYAVAHEVGKVDNQGVDLDPTTDRVHIQERSEESYLDRHMEIIKDFRTQYDASRASWVTERSESRHSLKSDGYHSSQRTVKAGKFSAGHFYGLEMNRSPLGFQIIQYDLDLDNPQNSVIYDAPHIGRQTIGW